MPRSVLIGVARAPVKTSSVLADDRLGAKYVGGQASLPVATHPTMVQAMMRHFILICGDFGIDCVFLNRCEYLCLRLSKLEAVGTGAYWYLMD